MRFKPSEKIWIIGASDGIGKALAIKLAEAGHVLALSARNEQALTLLSKDLDGDHHLVMPLDVSNAEMIKAAQAQLKADWGRVDRVIFMAGLYRPTQIKHMAQDDIEKIIAVNLTGAMIFTRIILDWLLEADRTQLAICASVAGYIGLPNSQPYGASKAGLINFTESLAAEMRGTKLDIKLINPGFVETRLTAQNQFKMPMIQTPEAAAAAIIKGLAGNKFEIAFPRSFVRMLKLLSLIPYRLYFKLAPNSK